MAQTPQVVQVEAGVVVLTVEEKVVLARQLLVLVVAAALDTMVAVVVGTLCKDVAAVADHLTPQALTQVLPREAEHQQVTTLIPIMRIMLAKAAAAEALAIQAVW